MLPRLSFLLAMVIAAGNAVPADAQAIRCPRPAQVTPQILSTIPRLHPRLARIANARRLSPAQKAVAVDSLFPGIDDVRVFEYLFCETYRTGRISREQYLALVRQILPSVPGVRTYRMEGRHEAASALLNEALLDLRAHAGSAHGWANHVGTQLQRPRPRAQIRHPNDRRRDSVVLLNLGDNMRRLCWQAGPTIPDQIRAALFPVAAVSSAAREFESDTVSNPSLGQQLQYQARLLRDLIDRLPQTTRSRLPNPVPPGPAPLIICNQEWTRITVRQE
jgi:hypothetical protein